VRITVDTNVMVSSAFWAGAPDQLMELVEHKKIELVLSEEIVKELINVLEYDDVKAKVKEKGLWMRRTVEKILSNSQIIITQEKIDAVVEDPDDNKIIECAVAGKVDCIVSRDNHLLKLKRYRHIRIMTPEEFLREFSPETCK